MHWAGWRRWPWKLVDARGVEQRAVQVGGQNVAAREVVEAGGNPVGKGYGETHFSAVENGGGNFILEGLT